MIIYKQNHDNFESCLKVNVGPRLWKHHVSILFNEDKPTTFRQDIDAMFAVMV